MSTSDGSTALPERPQNGPTSPRHRPNQNIVAKLWNEISLSWLSQLLRLGITRPLAIDDLYATEPAVAASPLVSLFDALWLKEKHRIASLSPVPKSNFNYWATPGHPALVRILILMFAKFLYIGLIKLFSDICNAMGPILLKYLISYVSESQAAYVAGREPPPPWRGYVLATGMFVLAMCASTSFSQFFVQAGGAGIAARAMLTSVIHRKAMKLSGKERLEFNTGKITNMVSSDLSRIEMFFSFFHLMWTFVFQLALIVALLINTLGVSALAGIGLLLAMVPLQGTIIKRIVNLRKANAGITDARVKLINEVLQGIRILKFFAWEDSYYDRITGIRDDELKVVLSSSYIRAVITALGFAVPVLSAAIAFLVYGAISPVFDPIAIFAALALFNQLRPAVMVIPQLIAIFADAFVGIKRIQALLEAEELDYAPVLDTSAPNAVRISRGDFTWDSAPSDSAINVEEKGESVELLKDEGGGDVERWGRAKLRGVETEIGKGQLCFVVGRVGAGKSTLLSSMIGETRLVNSEGSITFSGSVGYCPQEAWIMNATVRENILFGRPYDEEWYRRVIDACALTRDFEVLPGGDMAEIGERGINLSGGQKQRVSLARVCYFNSDIVLLDDCLSAVDAIVGRHIMNNCIRGLLGSKTVVLATHQLHFAPLADKVVVVHDGEIVEQGSYADLMGKADGSFAEMMRTYGGVSDGETTDDESEKKHETKEKKKDEEDGGDAGVKNKEEGKAIMTAEERMTGSIKAGVFIAYGRAMGGPMAYVILFSALALAQAVRLAMDIWLTSWTQDQYHLPTTTYMAVYAVFGAGQAIMTLVFCVLVANIGNRASRSLHSQALKRILATPSGFFDTTPLGRVLNRFSRDVDTLDNTLPDALRVFVLTFATVLGTFGIVAAATTGWFLIALVPMIAGYAWVQRIYRATSRELKRMDALLRSPLYAHIAESIDGVATIRAYGEVTRFMDKTDVLVDDQNRPAYLLLVGQRWLGLRLETIGNILVFCISLFAVGERNVISASLMGLALSYSLQTSQLLQLCVRQFVEAEVQLNAVERLNYYANDLSIEDPTDRKPDRYDSWPSSGNMQIQHLSMRYADGLPLVLKDVNINVNGGDKVGIVGRTGSGKSSLTLALFRLVEPLRDNVTLDDESEVPGSKVLIDGVDVLREVGLKQLRSKLSIIPQDPVLFSGSIRSNLDPFGRHDEAELWDALERAGMKETVRGLEGSLDARVEVGGDNLSVGQRQLMCLARAILTKAKIIVMDEVTASVDHVSDAFIQRSLREDFADATVLTIAHRLNTIIDYDKVLVMDHGKVVEYDRPAKLLEIEGGSFAALVDETGPVSSGALRNAAKAAAKIAEDTTTGTAV
ncbi:P-loop containing nucleoside triphosphate hydrolase protein [Cladochytrium replicatum]|nr:P-loop containing nucleoside triphosphate hydrolase protein [Cladochytrium replicatum]